MLRTQDALFARVMRRGSTTYYHASLFFPPAVRRNVAALYAFVRRADDFVDAVPQDRDGFQRFAAAYRNAAAGKGAAGAGLDDEDALIVDSFVSLMRRKSFDPAWIDAFLRAMEADLTKVEYNTIEETLAYVYGSAEAVGLCMARLLDLPAAADDPARLLGRAMQYINFIRDIAEDNALGRRYLPLGGSCLASLMESEARRRPEAFASLIRSHLARYREWQEQAEKGYRYIPRRFLIPIKTASAMYAWTARRIDLDPFIVYRRKVKPSPLRIAARAIRELVQVTTWPNG